MKVTVTLELTKEDVNTFMNSSVERVLNNAIEVGAEGENKFKDQGMRECASILWQDCEDLKPVLRKIHQATREAIYTELQGESDRKFQQFLDKVTLNVDKT